MKELEIKEIGKDIYEEWILKKHYAQRMPSISFAYGLFLNDKVIGVCTIGKPASNSLCEGVLGKEYKSKVYELNRLISEDNLCKNTLSYFLSNVLKRLKEKDIILISYADSGMNHCGYIYQATNWIYTGKTKERTDKYTPNGKHSRHYTEEYNHLRKVRTSKYRYVYFCTNKKNKKEYLKELKYEICEYPKEENKNYVLGERIKTKIFNKETNSYFFE